MPCTLSRNVQGPRLIWFPQRGPLVLTACCSPSYFRCTHVGLYEAPLFLMSATFQRCEDMLSVADLEKGRAGSGPPLGDGPTPSLHVLLISDNGIYCIMATPSPVISRRLTATHQSLYISLCSNTS